MKNKELSRQFVRMLRELLNSEAFKNRAKMRAKDFTRDRKLGFKQTFSLLLGGTKKSLQAMLNEFFIEMDSQHNTYSKQAFSKRRRQIRPEAIYELFQMSVGFFYGKADCRLWNGYHLMAVDGSKYNLPISQELIEKYNAQKSNGAPQVQALCSCLYDVLNEMLVDVRLTDCKGNEREEFKGHIRVLDSLGIKNVAILVDRGYPSAELVDLLESLGLTYVMRCSSTFYRSIKITDSDCVTKHKFRNSPASRKLRMITLSLDSGESEVLMTNIMDKGLGLEEFRDLYAKRWGIESNYNDLKSKLEIECFSGLTEQVILQDFYASMLLNNMAGMIAFDNAAEIQRFYEDSNSDNKHEYKQNISMVISSLRSEVVKLILLGSNLKAIALLNKIQKQLQRCVVPVRPGRSFERKKKHSSNKYPMNKRPL